ncbi:hypothetical protein WM15_01895 [Burkholderia ubonensis]|nr:hypothetical protein WM15_01895 [Burkholderia ubonensis]
MATASATGAVGAGDVRFVDVPGGRVWTRRIGARDGVPLVLLHGGPGCPHDYLEPFEALADARPVLFYDQLGCGASDRPDDPALWQLERFVLELEAVIDTLGPGPVHLLGHSWGTMLALDYALAHPERVASLVLASPCLSMTRVRADMARLKAALPAPVLAVLERCEANGTTRSGAYDAAALVFYRRHLCRLAEWPQALVRAETQWGWDVYRTMWGPAEFTPTGNLGGYERETQLASLRCPVLYTCGRHDEITPDSTAQYHRLTPGSECVVFEQSAHLPHLEEPARYLATVRDFLSRVEQPAPQAADVATAALEARVARLPPEALAMLMRWTRFGDATEQEGPVARPRGPSTPLSPAQERLWFLEQLQGSTGAYHLQVVLDFGQTLSIEALEGALNAIVARHEALRTRFVMEGGVPMQRVVPYLDVPLEQFDLRGLADPPAEAAARVAQGTARAFDLERGPLVRAWLLRIRDDQYRLLVVLHHIVSDGWSLGVLVRELNALYAAHAVGVVPALEPLPLQYPDYALWQRERLRNGGLDEHRQWWLAQLAGAPPLLDLPTDRPRPAVERANGAARAFVVPPALAARVRTLARAHDATLFMVLLAVFGALLARWSGRTDLVVGTPIAGRSRPELEGLIGFFVNMLALRIDARPEQRVEALIDQVRAVTVAAYEHQDVPFEQLVDALQPERSLSYAPVYQVAFALQNLPGERDANALPGGGEAVSEPVEGAARFDLTLSLSEQGEGLAGSCEYRTDLFDHATIGWLCGRYLAMLEAVVDDPGQPVGRLPMRAGSDPALPSEGAAVQAIGLTAASRVASVDDASSVLAAALVRTAKARRAPLAKATHIVTTPEALAGLCAGDLPPAATLVVSGLPCFSAPLARWREQRLLGLWAPDGVPVARLALGEHEAVLAAALDGHRIDVVDAQGESQPCGVAGVLRIDGVETGWLARRRADGTIRVDGRVERIVRLQGVHADPQRALALLRQHPAVADAGVTVQSAGNRHDARLAAWVVPRSAGGIGAAELAEYAAEHLGAGLAPSSITLLDAAPGADWLDAERAHVRDGAPSTPIEALLARIWSDVLKRAQTDIDANFFDEGGNSVGSVQIIARIRDATRIDIPLHQLFEAPSIRQLARLIERQQHLALAPAADDGELDRWLHETDALRADEIARFVDSLDEPEIDELLARLKERAI